jgi:hypothetical protein
MMEPEDFDLCAFVDGLKKKRLRSVQAWQAVDDEIRRVERLLSRRFPGVVEMRKKGEPYCAALHRLFALLRIGKFPSGTTPSERALFQSLLDTLSVPHCSSGAVPEDSQGKGI